MIQLTDSRTSAPLRSASSGGREHCINRGYGSIFFWDGRERSLEQQVLLPIVNPDEMDLPLEEAERRTGFSRTQLAATLAS